MGLRRIWSSTLILAALFFLSACAGTGADVESPASSIPESAYCTTRNSHPIAFDGEAQFAPRLVDAGGLTAQTGTPIDIIGAEVKIFDASGALVNCAETDTNGEFSSSVPAVGNYSVKVYSRGDNNLVKVSVLNNPTSNTPYELSATQNITGGATVTLTANSSGSVLAGAFNIFHQVYVTNTYLRAQVSGFTVAPKVAIYWTLGLSPGAYYNQPGTAISFFTPSGFGSALRGIYILGGVNGDSTCQDTDHFDNSIVIHEYGHFLEDIYAGSDSPGGSHDGNSLIDPRLAWSEGWANFIQAAARAEGRYRDTVGNPDCSGSHGLAINFNLDDTATRDAISSSVEGEGHFRELSISRLLYDIIQASASNFQHIWTAFDDLSSQSRPFRNARDLYTLMNTAGQIATLDTLLAVESQQRMPAATSTNSNPFYSEVLSAQDAQCDQEIRGVANSTVMGVSVPNPHQSNHYYAYYYDGSFGSTFTFFVQRINAESSRLADLDWFIYPADHNLSSLSNLVAGKDYNIDAVNTSTRTNSNASETKVLNFSGRPAGWYLIRVFVDTQENGGASINQSVFYNIRNGAKYLCPSGS